MKVLFINNDGGGFADYLDIQEGTSIKDFVSDSVNGDPHDYLIRVNRQPVGSDYVLQENDRVTVTPNKIQGAYLRLDSVVNQDDRLDYLEEDGCRPVEHWDIPDVQFDEESDIDHEELSPEDLIFLASVL